MVHLLASNPILDQLGRSRPDTNAHPNPADPDPHTNAGTRDPSQTPFASNSVFNLPLGSGAQWTQNAQLAGANVYVNT